MRSCSAAQAGLKHTILPSPHSCWSAAKCLLIICSYLNCQWDTLNSFCAYVCLYVWHVQSFKKEFKLVTLQVIQVVLLRLLCTQKVLQSSEDDLVRLPTGKAKTNASCEFLSELKVAPFLSFLPLPFLLLLYLPYHFDGLLSLWEYLQHLQQVIILVGCTFPLKTKFQYLELERWWLSS